jgi:hypothetical protein
MILEYLLSYRGSCSLKSLFWLHTESLLSLLPVKHRLAKYSLTAVCSTCHFGFQIELHYISIRPFDSRLYLDISRSFKYPHCSKVPSWSWSYGSWIYNCQCNWCLSPLTLWVRIPLRQGVLDTTLCDKVCQWLAAGWWFSLGPPVSSTNKTDRHDITKILLKVALFTIKSNQTNHNCSHMVCLICRLVTCCLYCVSVY